MEQQVETAAFEDVRLPPAIRWPMLGGLVAVFLFAGERPVWQNPFDIDRAIWLSYAPIPILVAVGLWWSHRLSIRTMLLNTMEIVLSKFALTYLIAIPLWATYEAPPAPLAPRPPSPLSAEPPAEAPAPTPWPSDARRSLEGRVETQRGDPIEGAVVYVSGGLDDLVFERPVEPRQLRLGSFADVVIARRWQPLHVLSSDGELHTVQIVDDHGRMVNLPVLPSGAPTAVRLHDLQGMHRISCAVHKDAAHFLVLDHPFHARSDVSGRFVLAGMPTRDVTVTAWTRESTSQRPVALSEADARDVRLVLGSSN